MLYCKNSRTKGKHNAKTIYFYVEHRLNNDKNV